MTTFRPVVDKSGRRLMPYWMGMAFDAVAGAKARLEAEGKQVVVRPARGGRFDVYYVEEDGK